MRDYVRDRSTADNRVLQSELSHRVRHTGLNWRLLYYSLIHLASSCPYYILSSKY